MIDQLVGFICGVIFVGGLWLVATVEAQPPACPDKHAAMQSAIEFSIAGYELSAPMPMDVKPIRVSDLGGM